MAHWMNWSMNVLIGAEARCPNAAVMPMHHLLNRWL
jgi:hypothetical protein